MLHTLLRSLVCPSAFTWECWALVTQRQNEEYVDELVKNEC